MKVLVADLKLNYMKNFFIIILILTILGLIVWWHPKKEVSPEPVSTGTQMQNENPTPSLNNTSVYSGHGFSVTYPQNYSVDEKYVYQALGPQKDISGVSFTIPDSMTTGTNLSTDTKLSVEWLPKSTACSPKEFMISTAELTTTVDNGVTYSVGKSMDAAAGNRYEEIVYTLKNATGDCYAIRYFIHYGAIENYPEGTTTPFDRTSLIAQFDTIRRSLVFTK